MVFGFAAMVMAVLAMMILPAGIYAAIKIVNRVFPSQPHDVPVPLAIDARLRRMEEAIDAMAQQIEQMRLSDRYVSGRADYMPLLPPSDDPPTFS